MPAPKSELLEIAAFVLASVTDDINNPNTPDTATVTSNDAHDAKSKLKTFMQKITVDGAPFIVIVAADLNPNIPLPTRQNA